VYFVYYVTRKLSVSLCVFVPLQLLDLFLFYLLTTVLTASLTSTTTCGDGAEQSQVVVIWAHSSRQLITLSYAWHETSSSPDQNSTREPWEVSWFQTTSNRKRRTSSESRSDARDGNRIDYRDGTVAFKDSGIPVVPLTLKGSVQGSSPYLTMK
jgi:hypothetical protein